MSMRPRVTARIFGGLGNQLFCYAAARRLALVNEVPLYLDVRSGFQRDQYSRQYLLDRFNIPYQEADSWDAYLHPGGRFSRYATKWLNRRLPFNRRWYIEEAQSHQFDARLLSLKVHRPVYLAGYWQSERYFADVADVIRSDLGFRGPHSAASVRLAEQMRDTASVSLHLRSYSEVSYTSDWHSVLSLEYYHAALQQVNRSVDQPIFYCFSDDIDWARTHLQVDRPVVFVDANMDRGYDGAIDDLWLMSQCRHHIVSNSTFSWWGAWLGETASEVVVAPRRISLLSEDYFPDRWTKA